MAKEAAGATGTSTFRWWKGTASLLFHYRNSCPLNGTQALSDGLRISAECPPTIGLSQESPDFAVHAC